MRHFYYKDNNKSGLVTGFLLTETKLVRKLFDNHPIWTAPILFECDAPDIMEADKLFTAATGFVAAKKPNIGVS